ncbi:MAG: hypothetical protein QGE99_00455 [SAR202 cluster bacterium]|jgi:hypothetical protein|nr:hypothetical protein [SAR202 cluster bacterium]|tara:strand:+ start:272 stop:433 length:162 start_codon:yes stop_codon:yes gene_type:complete
MKVAAYCILLLSLVFTSCGGGNEDDSASATAVSREEIHKIVEKELEKERRTPN